jgi:hypothetical protein
MRPPANLMRLGYVPDRLSRAKKLKDVTNKRTPMSNGTETVGKTYSSSTYHVLTNNESESLCGQLNEKEYLGSNVALRLTETEAEQQGFTLCGHCARLADSRG